MPHTRPFPRPGRCAGERPESRGRRRRRLIAKRACRSPPRERARSAERRRNQLHGRRHQTLVRSGRINRLEHPPACVTHASRKRDRRQTAAEVSVRPAAAHRFGIERLEPILRRLGRAREHAIRLADMRAPRFRGTPASSPASRPKAGPAVLCPLSRRQSHRSPPTSRRERSSLQPHGRFRSA